MKKFAFLLPVIAAALLTACTVDAPARPQPRFTYKQYPPVLVNVANIQVVEQYVSPAQKPNVEHLMPLPLPNAVADWARSRFQTTGSDGTLIITITDASMKEQFLQRTEGVRGIMTVDQAERYDARISVDFRVENMAMGETGSGQVNLTRGQSLAENASIQDRDMLWNSLSETMLTDLDAATLKMQRAKLPFLAK